MRLLPCLGYVSEIRVRPFSWPLLITSQGWCGAGLGLFHVHCWLHRRVDVDQRWALFSVTRDLTPQCGSPEKEKLHLGPWVGSHLVYLSGSKFYIQEHNGEWKRCVCVFRRIDGEWNWYCISTSHILNRFCCFKRFCRRHSICVCIW